MTEWQPSVRKLPPDDHLFDEGNLFRESLAVGQDFKVSNISQSEVEQFADDSQRLRCHACRALLPTNRLLDIHIQEAHDSFFEVLSLRSPLYQCLVEDCGQLFQTGVERDQHLVVAHFYPQNYSFTKKPR
eukprot:TRINITY_DN1273_c0_g1_i1.p1 TRINITY_DN1273_c0_g1~~TRINITY_DN1273_c0_g1_i1.p1  ORF type:complete len:130 (-),score=12.62 TRINITY_DN1273_c0_g1_i1:68-457(-)